MSVPAAFIGVILIWSTTPLAIKWSSADWGFLFAVTGRMTIGAALCWVLMIALRMPLPWNKAALRVYGAAALAIYAAMMMVYWGAQFIPSGLVSILYALTPIMTGIMAALWLNEPSLTPGRIVGTLLGFAGVAWIFKAQVSLEHVAWEGIAMVLGSVATQSASAILIKRVNIQLPALSITTGAMSLAVPMYWVTWAVVDGRVPQEIPFKAGMAVAYLGVFGSVLGFSLYFYVLKHLEASRVALITLVTPIMAVLFGKYLNGEQGLLTLWVGMVMILLGLAMHQWADQWLWVVKGGRRLLDDKQ